MHFEVKLGEKIIRNTGPAPEDDFIPQELTTEIEPDTDGELKNLYIVSRPDNPDETTFALTSIQFLKE